MNQILNNAIVPELGENFELGFAQTSDRFARANTLNQWLRSEDPECVDVVSQLGKLALKPRRFRSAPHNPDVNTNWLPFARRTTKTNPASAAAPAFVPRPGSHLTR